MQDDFTQNGSTSDLLNSERRLEELRLQCAEANVPYMEYLRRRNEGMSHKLALSYDGDPDKLPSVKDGYTVGQLKKICSQHNVMFAVYMARRRSGWTHEQALISDQEYN